MESVLSFAFVSWYNLIGLIGCVSSCTASCNTDYILGGKKVHLSINKTATSPILPNDFIHIFTYLPLLWQNLL